MSKQYKRKKKAKEQIVNFPHSTGVVQAVCTRNNGEKVRQSCGGYRSRDIRCFLRTTLPVGKRDVMDLLRHSRLVAFLFVSIISFQIHEANAVPMVSYRVGNQLRLSPVLVPVSSTVMPVDLMKTKHRSYDERLTPTLANQPKAEFRKSKREKTESFFWPLKLY
ncbi:hypothetical protein DAPPUDRAFT_301973 [Daphnia pulex]|uniref:Uncharacterized protein n=1 Tax=Daphnia pulex TaxID=6669 RepID=E9GB98_DAPPU|nr:hypothetical protein DAPPUDRAFT_301973 [Daphnia pulex]|eukprot:EFX83395.1 hypothetical protein DAPPUDRAFT_301973 [Daphnia pulex]